MIDSTQCRMYTAKYEEENGIFYYALCIIHYALIYVDSL